MNTRQSETTGRHASGPLTASKQGSQSVWTGCRTRKEAIEKYEEMKEAVVKILEDTVR